MGWDCDLLIVHPLPFGRHRREQSVARFCGGDRAPLAIGYREAVDSHMRADPVFA